VKNKKIKEELMSEYISARLEELLSIHVSIVENYVTRSKKKLFVLISVGFYHMLILLVDVGMGLVERIEVVMANFLSGKQKV